MFPLVARCRGYSTILSALDACQKSLHLIVCHYPCNEWAILPDLGCRTNGIYLMQASNGYLRHLDALPKSACALLYGGEDLLRVKRQGPRRTLSTLWLHEMTQNRECLDRQVKGHSTSARTYPNLEGFD